MSLWVPITEDDFLDSLSAVEASLFRSNAKVSESDPLPGLISKVTMQVRGAVRSNPDNIVPADTTLVPPAAVPHAVAILRYRLLSKMPDIEISDARRDEYKEALAWLNLVRRGEEAIENPDGATTDKKPTPSPRINARQKRFGRDSQDGI